MLVVISSLGAIACRRAPTPRERALALLPGVAQLVAAADGPVLADPVLRKAFDALRPRVSDQLGCVIDAALAADAVAVAGTRTTGAVIAIAAASPPPACPALSRVADDLWVATIGDATVAPAREASVLAVSRWARARRYIEDAPVALAIDLGGAHLVAAAQVAPFQAWATLDAPPAIAAFAEARLRARLDGWRIAGAAPAAKVRAERAGGQLVVRADSLDADELGKLAPALLDDLVDPPPPPRAAPRLECPDRKIVERCTGPTSFDVVSVSGALAEMLFVPTTPVAASGAVIGLRLEADPPLLLRRGDIVLGIDGVPVRAQRDLVQLVEDRSRTRAAVAVRRAGVDLVVTLAGHIE